MLKNLMMIGLNFIKLFDQLKDKNFAGNLRKTSESIGQSPEKIKGIFTRTLGPGSKSSGHKPVISIPEPKNGILYSQTTTNMKSNPDVFKELILIKGNKATILFSPASASYDQFNSFVDRGNQFKKITRSYVKKFF